jgi:colanic acid/amylovoran biosynthesis glycosyltransferase
MRLLRNNLSRVVVHFKAGPYLPLTETWIYSQIRHMIRYTPAVYALETQNLEVFPTKTVRCLGTGGRSSPLRKVFNERWAKVLYASYRFCRFLFVDRPHLIHAHFGPSGYDCLRVKSVFGLPVVTSFYGYDLQALLKERPEWDRKYKRLFASGDLFLVEGNHMKRCLMNLGCPEDKIMVQHLGIDLERVAYQPRKIGLDGRVAILIASSFREKKGIPYALEAIGRFRMAHPGIQCKITIIGDSSGTESEELQKQSTLQTIQKYRLEDTVRLLGYQTHDVFIEELFEHHIFMAPSVHASDGDTEGGAPVSIIEASASGMPVISTLHCDIPEVILDGESGYLVPERDVDGLRKLLNSSF